VVEQEKGLSSSPNTTTTNKKTEFQRVDGRVCGDCAGLSVDGEELSRRNTDLSHWKSSNKSPGVKG
jgi:hypothetical protein